MSERDLNEVVVFAEVVRAGSFTRAAKTLGMPKSTVSRKVARLEERLGARLLHRTTRRLRLTEVGASYFGRCELALSHLDEAEQLVAESQAAPRGVLRLTAPSDFGEAFLGGVIAAYLRLHEDTRVEVVLTERLVDLVAEGFDIAIRAGPLRDSALVSRRLAPARLILCASPAYLEARGVPETPEELSEHECVIFTNDARRRTTWSLSPRRGPPVLVPVRGSVAVNSFVLVREAALAGLGIGSLPAFVAARAVEEGRLARVLEGLSPPASPLHALYPSTRHLPAKVRAFLDLLREQLNPPPWALDPRPPG